MLINRAIKVRLYLNKTQQNKIDNTLNCCRFVYNHMLTRNKKVYRRRGDHLSWVDMSNLLPTMKEYYPWLKEADSQALKYTCRQVDDAFQRFFKGQGGYPKYKSKRGKQSYTTTKGTSIHIDYENRRVKLPTLEWIKCRGLRTFDYDVTIKRATVSRESNGNYYVSINYQYEIDVKPASINKDFKALGLDYKISGLYVDSNNYSPNKDKHFAMAMDKLKVEQQKLSYKKGSGKNEPKSKRYLKQLGRVKKVHRHISNQRKDFLHKQSAAIAKSYDVVCIEDISIKDMYVQYDKDIGNHVAEHNINHTVADDGWYMFTQMLEYKLTEQGKYLVKVDKDYPSTETCSRCGHRQPMPLKVRMYRCPECGLNIGRDHNSAINTRDEGLRILKIAMAA